MKELTIFEKDGNLWTDSREVAAMVEKQHKHLLADIRNYIAAMENSNEPKIRPVDFFVGSKYIDEKGQERPCFLCSKRGCDMIANKLTGDKGIIFSAVYVTRFEEMERVLKSSALVFPVKATSAGEVARVLHEERATMIAQRSNPRNVARQVEATLKHFGLPVIAEFVEPEPPEQIHL